MPGAEQLGKGAALLHRPISGRNHSRNTKLLGAAGRAAIVGWGALGWGAAAPRVLSPDKAPACMAAVPGAVGAAPDPLCDPRCKSLNLSTPGSLVCKVELMIILPLSWLLLGWDCACCGGGSPAGTCALQDATGRGTGGLAPRLGSHLSITLICSAVLAVETFR